MNIVSLNDLEDKLTKQDEPVLPAAPKLENNNSVAHLGEMGEWAEKIIEAMLHDKAAVVNRYEAILKALDLQIEEIRQRIRAHYEFHNEEVRALTELDKHLATGLNAFNFKAKNGRDTSSQ